MSYEWEKIRLGDVSKVITDKIEISEINKKNYISTENMLPNFEGVVPASTIPNAKKVNAFRAKDILFSNIRTYFKKVWYATMDGGCSADVLVFRPKNSAIDNQFLSYVLKNEKFISYTVTTSKGTKMPRGDKKAIMNYQFYKPNLIDQQKITYILSTLDDKIELNKKINQTLESIAQAIFKSWFVDFDPVHAKANAQSEDEYDAIAKELGISREILDLFPSEFEESELGLIPKGWKVKNIQNIISVKDGTHDSPKPKKIGFPLITSKHIKNGVIDLASPNLISEEDFNKVNKRSKVEKNDILIGMIGTVGDLYFVSNDEINFAIKNIGLFKTSENEFLSEYIFYWLKSNKIRDYILTRLAGTTQKYISLTELRKIPLLCPPKLIIFQFKVCSKNFFELKKCKNIESQAISEVRNRILPKLLSGEVEVSALNLEPEND
ncbi:TPA: restriction endonuclease subunit S [Legionella pneumophila]|uniref:restriction endonuclease subunit S n=1 Tax=Legionella pneumophila TaxID=446 RepID=UPI000776D91C|nr:restriction endonuclease subunit S [Legionella pneumophila]HAT8638804.1 restriction endonuclease subunit S [Legionella pneumophila]HAU0706899.1 restriction endonuclease subunit S [Legionella pneumophila]